MKDEKEKEEEQKVEQNHLIHMASVILKTKLTATFTLDPTEDFQNNFLNYLQSDFLTELLALTPTEALPLLKNVRQEFEQMRNAD